jgi:hypothetical protein
MEKTHTVYNDIYYTLSTSWSSPSWISKQPDNRGKQHIIFRNWTRYEYKLEESYFKTNPQTK